MWQVERNHSAIHSKQNPHQNHPREDEERHRQGARGRTGRFQEGEILHRPDSDRQSYSRADTGMAYITLRLLHGL